MPPLPVPEAQEGQGIARAAHGQQGQIQGACALVQARALEADQQRGQAASVTHGSDQGQGLFLLQPPDPRARGAGGRGVLIFVLKGEQQDTHQ